MSKKLLAKKPTKNTKRKFMEHGKRDKGLDRNIAMLSKYAET